MLSFAANLEFLFHEKTVPGRLSAAATAGFRGVEIPYLSLHCLSSVRDCAQRTGVEVVLSGLPLGDLEQGGPGYMGVPGQRRTVERAVRSAVRTADALGCRRIALPPSRVPANLDRETCLAALTDHVACAADIAAPYGIEVVIEPLNSVDWPGFLITRTQDALDVIASAGKRNVGLQLDLYHATMQGETPSDSIRRSITYLRHVQFADVPGRHEPGTGTLPLRELFSTLDELGYQGWVAAEYIPTRRTEETLSWLRECSA
jgi:hydroxypyruvate isomerase